MTGLDTFFARAGLAHRFNSFFPEDTMEATNAKDRESGPVLIPHEAMVWTDEEGRVRALDPGERIVWMYKRNRRLNDALKQRRAEELFEVQAKLSALVPPFARRKNELRYEIGTRNAKCDAIGRRAAAGAITPGERREMMERNAVLGEEIAALEEELCALRIANSPVERELEQKRKTLRRAVRLALESVECPVAIIFAPDNRRYIEERDADTGFLFERRLARDDERQVRFDERPVLTGGATSMQARGRGTLMSSTQGVGAAP